MPLPDRSEPRHLLPAVAGTHLDHPTLDLLSERMSSPSETLRTVTGSGHDDSPSVPVPEVSEDEGRPHPKCG